jgi:two-component system response regulator MtrA
MSEDGSYGNGLERRWVDCGSVRHPRAGPGDIDSVRATMNGTLLLVEDDLRIRRALVLALNDENYRVLEAASGEEALRHLAQPDHPVELVLLDLMLPGIDGLGVCRRIREQGDMPIIIVTARTDSTDVIAGLEAGADDYVTKPLVASELAARVRALMRRTRGPATLPAFTVGAILVEPAEGRAQLETEDIHLTKTELRLLCELAAAGGRVVTREQLLERVWDYDYFGDTRLLDVHISRLRRKVEDDATHPEHVLTVRGQGYRLVP